MGYPAQGTGGTGTGDATLANQTTILTRLSAARAAYLDNLSGGAVGLNADMATVLSRLSAARAGYLDAINRGRPNMIFPSATPKAIIVVPAVGGVTDIDFPDVVVAGLPSGLTIAKADIALIIGGLFDTSASENQIAAAAKTLRVKIAAGAWGTNDIVALTFVQNALQTKGDAYRGGPVLFGGTDIKSVVAADGTYNFRSRTNEPKRRHLRARGQAWNFWTFP